MSQIPDTFTLHVGNVSYFVYRVPGSGAVGPSCDVRPVWAFRPEGKNSGAADGLQVIPDESFANLKARIAAYVQSP